MYGLLGLWSWHPPIPIYHLHQYTTIKITTNDIILNILVAQTHLVIASSIRWRCEAAESFCNGMRSEKVLTRYGINMINYHLLFVIDMIDNPKMAFFNPSFNMILNLNVHDHPGDHLNVHDDHDWRSSWRSRWSWFMIIMTITMIMIEDRHDDNDQNLFSPVDQLHYHRSSPFDRLLLSTQPFLLEMMSIKIVMMMMIAIITVMITIIIMQVKSEAAMLTHLNISCCLFQLQRIL